MTQYEWVAVERSKLKDGVRERPTGEAAAALRQQLLRPVSGHDGPIWIYGQDHDRDPVVVMVDNPTTEGCQEDWVVVLNAIGGENSLHNDLHTEREWNRGTIDAGADGGFDGRCGFVEKWLVALVVAQEWAFGDVGTQLAGLNTDHGGRTDDRDAAPAVSALYNTFRLRKGRLWWRRVSPDPYLQGAYVRLQGSRGCADMHDQMMQETALWRDHVASAHNRHLNNYILLLSFLAGAIGLVSIVATITSSAGQVWGALCSLVTMCLVLAALWMIAGFRRAAIDEVRVLRAAKRAKTHS